jgi:hypothetical integral membrane protein (TIGR02206 family)
MLLDIIIDPFTTLWWKMIFFSVAMIAIPIIIAKYIPSSKDFIRLRLGRLLVATAIAIHPYLIATHSWNLQSSLPLHLCSLSGILSGVVLLFPSQIGFELLMYWGITGAIHSLLTPELTQGKSDFLFMEYYISHSGIIGSAMFLTFSYDMKLRKISWIKIFYMTQLLLPIIGTVDYFLHSNYMYLRERPEANNPLIVGEWPWYIIIFEILLLIHFYIIYFIFYIQRKSSKLSVA